MKWFLGLFPQYRELENKLLVSETIIASLQIGAEQLRAEHRQLQQDFFLLQAKPTPAKPQPTRVRNWSEARKALEEPIQ